MPCPQLWGRQERENVVGGLLGGGCDGGAGRTALAVTAAWRRGLVLLVSPVPPGAPTLSLGSLLIRRMLPGLFLGSQADFLPQGLCIYSSQILFPSLYMTCHSNPQPGPFPQEAISDYRMVCVVPCAPAPAPAL